jgi:serine/threonine protein phosphatase PrpC
VAAETQVRQAQVATPITAERGAESPLDVGWTGPVSRDASPAAPVEPIAPVQPNCAQCGQGSYVDGYCDNCGSKQRDPRDHFTEEPQPWVAGVCDIGIRHSRNEDAMALYAEERQLSFAVLVVCDGVSNSTDSHIASLAASRAARDVLDGPIPRGMGTRTAIIATIEQRLDEAVQAAKAAVVETTKDREVENPPSCTFVAALVDDGMAVLGNVGDSRAYWLPDDPASQARQLSQDDSFADEQIRAGVPRKEAETSAGAHAITRWLGTDSPDDITPHTTVVELDEDGWLAVVSDGLWNYCSEASDLRELVRTTVERLGAAGRHPLSVAQALTDFANEQGGMDNITVALARVGQVDPAPPPTSAEPTSDPTDEPTADPSSEPAEEPRAEPGAATPPVEATPQTGAPTPAAAPSPTAGTANPPAPADRTETAYSADQVHGTDNATENATENGKDTP